MKEKEIKKLKEFIENIEQLGADSRWSLDFESWGALDTKLYSIIYWAKRARKIVQKIKEVEENEQNI